MIGIVVSVWNIVVCVLMMGVLFFVVNDVLVLMVVWFIVYIKYY